jgi:hypothetical protein
MVTGTRAMGCLSFKSAQKNACVCEKAQKEDKTIQEEEAPEDDNIFPLNNREEDEDEDDGWAYDEEAPHNPFGDVPDLPPLFKEGDVDPFENFDETMAEFSEASTIWMDKDEFKKTMKESKVTEQLKATAGVLKEALNESKKYGKEVEDSRDATMAKIKEVKKKVLSQNPEL